MAGQACPAVFYLAGLTCNEETFAIKAHAQHMAAQLGLILISPDTSPRGEAVAKGDHWDIGQGAGFYINATQAPWAAHYQMETFVADELYQLVRQQFPVLQIPFRQELHHMNRAVALHRMLARAGTGATSRAAAWRAAPRASGLWVRCPVQRAGMHKSLRKQQ